MKYQVLARRYRPRQFEEVVGQESVAATLRGAIQQDRIAHAYVFAGPRGVGKTSMARIFARALNCPEAADHAGDRSRWGVPCGTCSTCDAVHAGQDIDVVELDGASHRGIEDIRSIIEGVNRPATRSPFKIYIIDEVHMLTREAFNALLKTLEEPPPHVKFVFATTEPHRIPETVLSRCQRFDFQPIGRDAIVRRLSQILAAEGRAAEDGLLERIARYGRGGLRDAETLLDQLMTYSEATLRTEDLDRMTGRLPLELVSGLAETALGGDSASVLGHVRAAFEKGADPTLLLEQVVDSLRARLHEAVLGGGTPAEPGASPGRATGPAIDRLIGALQILLEGAQKLKYSSSPEASAELVLLKVSRLEDPAQLEGVIKALLEVEEREDPRGGAATPSAAPVASPSHAAPRASPRPPPAPVPPPVPVDDRAGGRGRAAPAPGPSAALDFRTLLSVWGQVGIELEAKHPDIAPYFKDRQPAPADESADTFVFQLEKEFYFRQMRMPERIQSFLSIVRDVSGAPWRCRLEHAGKSLASPSLAPRSEGPGGGPSQPPGPGQADASRASSAERPGAGGSEASQPAPARERGDGISRSAIVKRSVDLFRGRLV